MLNELSIDIVFLKETDSRALDKEDKFSKQGYTTILPEKEEESSKVRVIALVKNTIVSG
jgi:hypothetical protein